MSLLINRIIFKKTGLLLLVILFFLGCKKEKSTIGIDDPDRFPSNTYYTDTITVKSHVVLISDSINTTNLSTTLEDGSTTSILMAGAYTDPIFGKVAAEAYTRLRLQTEFVELPAAVADSGFLYLSYSNYYGNISQSQTLDVYKLDDYVSTDVTYFSNSAPITYASAKIGTVTFNASSDSASQLVIRITDKPYLQSILDASKNNGGFESEIRGIALVPSNNSDGAIIRIDGNSYNTALHVHYTQYGQSKIYGLTLNSLARKYFRVTADRSSTELASLVNNYDSISTDVLSSNRGYIQALTGIRTKLSFPYLKNLRETYPNIAIIKGELQLFVSATTDNFTPNSGLTLLRTENGKIKRTSAGTNHYVQPDDVTQTGNSSAIAVSRNTDNNSYTFPLKSFVQAVLLEQIAHEPIIVSPIVLSNEINRLAFDDQNNTSQPIKLKLYFTTTK